MDAIDPPAEFGTPQSCPMCNGRGRGVRPLDGFSVATLSYYSMPETCPKCEGTGQAPYYARKRHTAPQPATLP